MNFKVSHYLSFLISIATALFFILLGLFGALLPWFPKVRAKLAVFFLENSVLMFLFGLTLMFIGGACIAGIVYGSRRHYYSIKTSTHRVTVSDDVFHDYLSSYWKKIFPNTDVPCTVKIKDNQVHITADLPYVPLEEQKGLIEQMQLDVTDIFARYLGYRAEYLFSVSFLDNQPTVAKRS